MKSRLALLVLPLAACVSMLASSSCIQIGPSVDDTDGGADAEAEAGTATVQDQCQQIFTEYCARAQDCYGEDPQSCVETTVDACCGRYCSTPATSSQHSIDVCVSDIDQESCDDIDVETLPTRCQNVVTH